ncbi:hypothetical protein HDU87_008045 [Geranomyces variabilis]|uniref:Ubiquitin-like protease family profile domain-containing protein n=1 Tax=Geranomyces variabilis TaxID=109894 RepID=A0AAD5XSP0_9FUNG|nr:hypothetical protein HDU87_008045 [Geranomyces variabilis]
MAKQPNSAASSANRVEIEIEDAKSDSPVIVNSSPRALNTGSPAKSESRYETITPTQSPRTTQLRPTRKVPQAEPARRSDRMQPAPNSDVGFIASAAHWLTSAIAYPIFQGANFMFMKNVSNSRTHKPALNFEKTDTDLEPKSKRRLGHFPELKVARLIHEGVVFRRESDNVILKVHQDASINADGITIISICQSKIAKIRVVGDMCSGNVRRATYGQLAIFTHTGDLTIAEAPFPVIDRFVSQAREVPIHHLIETADEAEIAEVREAVQAALQGRKRKASGEHAPTPKPAAPSVELFRFPPEGKNVVTVKQDDYNRLDDGEFLNDVVVEFTLRYLLAQADSNLQEQIHLFNSFFYEQLSYKEEGTKRSAVPDPSGYDRVKKWTSKIDLFSKKYIFIPINENMHWYLALIYNPGALLEVDAEDTEVIDISEPLEMDPDEIALTLAVEKSMFEHGSSSMVLDLDNEAREGANLTQAASAISLDEPMDLDEPNNAPTGESNGSIEIDLLHEDPEPALAQKQRKKIKRKSLTAQEEAEKLAREAEKHEAKTVEAMKHCHIIILDSLENKHPGSIRRLKQYLVFEAKAKKNIEIDPKDITGIHAKVPRQPNFCDCGVYLSYYVEVFLRDPLKYLNIIFNRLVGDQHWFAVQDVQKKRVETKQIMDKLTSKATRRKAAEAAEARRKAEHKEQKTLAGTAMKAVTAAAASRSPPQSGRSDRLRQYQEEESKRKSQSSGILMGD